MTVDPTEFRFTSARDGTIRRHVSEPVRVGVGPPRYVKGRGGTTQRKAGRSTIEGLAAVYYDGTPRTEFDMGMGLVERIMPGAFDSVLKSKSSDVVALFNHNRDLLLGRESAGTLEIRSTKEGLAYRIEPGNTTVGADVLEHIRRRDVTGSSFSFKPLSETWTVDKARKLDIVSINDVKLFDVGPVTLAAYKATTTEAAQARELADLAGRLREYRSRAASVA